MPEETAHQRIQAICDSIRQETLEPAKEEADHILTRARKEAETIHHAARKEAEAILAIARTEMEQEKQFFLSSLQQAQKQIMEVFKLEIEQSLLVPAIEDWIEKALSPLKAQADLLSTLVEAIEKEGTSANIEAVISNKYSSKELVTHLSKEIITTLKDQSVTLGNIPGGVQARLLDKNITIDISSNVLEELILRYVRRDFRKFFFNA